MPDELRRLREINERFVSKRGVLVGGGRGVSVASIRGVLSRETTGSDGDTLGVGLLSTDETSTLI